MSNKERQEELSERGLGTLTVNTVHKPITVIVGSEYILGPLHTFLYE